MKERGILFNGEMVRAILDGRKTQTRREVKPQPEQTRAAGRHVIEVNNYHTGAPEHGLAYYWKAGGCWNSSEPFHCPFGQVGDRLWVRETFAAFDLDWRHPGKPHDLKDGPWPNLVYRADLEMRPDQAHMWRPSIHMPRWASRITLEITSVRVERLNEISEEDAKAEGVFEALNKSRTAGWGSFSEPPPFHAKPGDLYSYRHTLEDLWNRINGKDSWDANPWVWVIEFKRVK